MADTKRTTHIVHIDMDAFFAAIEQRDNPALRGKPVVVGANPKQGKGRGVVSTCSYEARKFGIHSAMPISTAYRKCPHGIYVCPDMEKYQNVSEKIYDILYTFTPDIEPISIDEAFLDVTGSYHLFGAPRDLCYRLKSKIKTDLQLTASIGMAPSKMIAKIASDLHKPDGCVIVQEHEITDFLRPLLINRIWGLGKKSVMKLHAFGIKTIGDMAERDLHELKAHFGAMGEYYWNFAHGIDASEVEVESEAKSISHEITFEKDTNYKREIKSAIMYLCEKVSNRLRRECIKAKTITLKIRLEGFMTYTRSKTVTCPTNYVEDIYAIICDLYEKFNGKKKIRLLGVKTSNFTNVATQLNLFNTAIYQKKEKVYSAIDKIKERFGSDAIYHVPQLKKRQPN